MRGVASAVIAAIIIGTLYVGREVFVPIALAVLLSFVLAPLVRLLQRCRMPRGLAVVGVVLLAFVSIFMLGGVIATEVTQLARDLPRYQFTMREKIQSLRGAAGTSGTLERAADVLHDLGKELNKPPSADSGAPLQTIAPTPDAKPIPVEVRQPPPTALESIAALISPLIHPLTTTGIIAIFVVFILLQREDLRNRLIKLAGSHDLQKTTAALDDAATRLSRLFLMQLEPLLYGHSTGLSPVAVVASATFWTALWGPIGLILATPLTVCLVVLGRHVERLEFLDVMFGDRPALSPPEIFYQRMLAHDPAEAVEKAEEFLKERPLSTYYDEVALPGLKLAQNDLTRGALDLAQAEKIKATILEVVENLVEEGAGTPAGDTTHDPEAAAAVEAVDQAAPDLAAVKREALGPEWKSDVPVLCVAGRSPLDQAAAAMMAQLLGKYGLGARVEGADAVATMNIVRLETADVALVCLSYLDAGSLAHMRYTIRRMRRRLPAAQLLLASWKSDVDAATLRASTKADAVATTLPEALRFCLEAARNSSFRANLQEPSPASATAA
jgi:predicted PurR-regulated permease PerM